MSINRLYGLNPKAKYKSYTGETGKTHKNLLLKELKDAKHQETKYIRNFKINYPGKVWTTDVSEFHIPSGKLYLSPILDMGTREIIAYDISSSPSFKQTNRMLDEAFLKHPYLSGLILHSDQGWQYQMRQYQERLKSKGIIQSMSRKGNCLDNSPMENFFSIMKREMFYGHEYDFESLNELEEAMREYINYYNFKRISIKTKGLSPYEYRQQSLSVLR